VLKYLSLFVFLVLIFKFSDVMAGYLVLILNGVEQGSLTQGKGYPRKFLRFHYMRMKNTVSALITGT
jgi:hypothetical protein